jgi:hypothetical protein
MTRRPVVGIVVIVVVFVAGVAAGSALSRGRPNGINVSVRMSTELPVELRRLELSPSQADSARHILIAGQTQMRRILAEWEPRMGAEIDAVDSALRNILTPSQRGRFDAELHKRRVDRMQVDTTKR